MVWWVATLNVIVQNFISFRTRLNGGGVGGINYLQLKIYLLSVVFSSTKLLPYFVVKVCVNCSETYLRCGQLRNKLVRLNFTNIYPHSVNFTKPRNLGTKEPRNLGTKEPRNQGA
jgi:hypothetical protein